MEPLLGIEPNAQIKGVTVVLYQPDGPTVDRTRIELAYISGGKLFLF